MTVRDLSPAPQFGQMFAMVADLLPPDLLVRLSGELDFSCVDQLDQIASEQLAEVSRVDVDLSGLLFSDLTGLRALLQFRARHIAEGRLVALRNPQPAVRRVFELAGHRHVLAA